MNSYHSSLNSPVTQRRIGKKEYILPVFQHTLHTTNPITLLRNLHTLPKNFRPLMPSPPQKNLHTLQHLRLQIRTTHILPRKTTIRAIKLKRLDRLPDGQDSRRR